MNLNIVRYKHYGGVMVSQQLYIGLSLNLVMERLLRISILIIKMVIGMTYIFTIQIAIHLVKTSLIGGIDIWQMTMSKMRCLK